jgi:hypothetical protein
MRGGVAAVSALALTAWLGACQPRVEPYRFRGPLVGSVAAGELDRRPGEGHRGGSGTSAARALPEVATGAAIARAAPEAEPGGLADELRLLVGVRDRDSTHVQFALDVIQHLGVKLDPELREVEAGRELVALARTRDAAEARSPLLGDLVVFDAVEGDEPASLVGVVISVDRAGTVELIHLSRGVVRRSYVNPGRPSATRDDQGHALNTFIRPGRAGDARGTRYLAGELFSTFIRLDRLARPR